MRQILELPQRPVQLPLPLSDAASMVENTPRLGIVVVAPTIPSSSTDGSMVKTLEKQKKLEGDATGLQGQTQEASGPTTPPMLYDFPRAPEPPLFVSPFKPSGERLYGWLDWIFAALFVANVVGMAAAVYFWGYDAVFDESASPDAVLSPKEARQVLKLGAILAVFAFVFALFAAKLLTTWPREVAVLAWVFSVATIATVSVVGFINGQFNIAIGSAAIAVVCFLSVRLLLPRVSFVVANLRVAGAALAGHQGVYVVAILSTIVQIVWILLCAVAFLGIASQLKIAREADYQIQFKPENAPCSDNAECASSVCVPPVSITVHFCGQGTTNNTSPTLKAAGVLCNTNSECASALCMVVIANAPRQCIGSGPTAGTQPLGAACSRNTECGSRNCVSKTTKTSSRCTKPDPSSSSPSPTARDHTILSLVGVASYWSLLVFKNVVQTTTTGVVAAFWFGSDTNGGTTMNALRRSLTSSLGAVSLASFLLATVVAALQAIKQSSESFLGSCADHVFSEVKPAVQYFNRWSLVYVSIYNHTFAQATVAVKELFAARGFCLIIDTDLEGRIMNYAAMGVASACCLLSIPLASLVGSGSTSMPDLDLIQQIVGIVAGLGIAMTPLAVVDSAVATVYVCFAEDPAALELAHPDLHKLLIEEWHTVCPDVMIEGGYMQTRQAIPSSQTPALEQSQTESRTVAEVAAGDVKVEIAAE